MDGDEISNPVPGSLWDTIEAENTLGWNSKIGEDRHERNKFDLDARRKEKLTTSMTS